MCRWIGTSGIGRAALAKYDKAQNKPIHLYHVKIYVKL